MRIIHFGFLIFFFVLALPGTSVAQSDRENTDQERDQSRPPLLGQQWVVVLEDPRPARLQGWRSNNYGKGNASYSNALELRRFGKRVAKRYNLDLKDQWLIESLNVYCLIVSFNGDAEQTIKQLNQDQKVQWVQPSNEFELLSNNKNQTSFALPPSRDEQLVGISESINGHGITIAMIDSAVDLDHPDLRTSIGLSENFIQERGIVSANTTQSARDGEAHGTAIAGVIVTKPDTQLGMAGVAPMATLNAYRGCWERSGGHAACNTLSLARALDAVSKSNADVLNLSLSGPQDLLLDRLISRIVDQGTVVVAAFDPTRSASQRFPSPQKGVLVVRAENLDKHHHAILAAPGARIVARPGNSYDYMQGHSVATAYASGVLALYKQWHTQWRSLENQPFTLSQEWPNLVKTNHIAELVDQLRQERSS